MAKLKKSDLNYDFSPEFVLKSLKISVGEIGLVNISSLTGISPGHLFSLTKYPNVYKLTSKMFNRILKSAYIDRLYSDWENEL